MYPSLDEHIVQFGRHVAEDALRMCASCAHSKPQAEFHASRTGQFSYCRDCRNAYDRRYYAERGKAARSERVRERHASVRAWMNSLKAGVPCADCGGSYPPPVMHWDHLPGHVKVGAVSSLAPSRRRGVVEEELRKCELVCGNCHALRTSRRVASSNSTT